MKFVNYENKFEIHNMCMQKPESLEL